MRRRPIPILTEERNQIAHSFWDGFGSPLLDSSPLPADGVVRIKITAKQKDGTLQWKRQSLSPADLDAMARRMDAIARDLIEFWRLNVGRIRLRFARHVAATVPKDEIFPP